MYFLVEKITLVEINSLKCFKLQIWDRLFDIVGGGGIKYLKKLIKRRIEPGEKKCTPKSYKENVCKNRKKMICFCRILKREINM